jgi:hypothetical protein
MKFAKATRGVTMTKLNAFWRVARLGALGLAVAIVIGVAAPRPAEARWHWNGATWVWIGPSYGPAYYYPPAPYYYAPYPAYYGYGYPGYYYGPSVGLSFRIH